MLTRSTAVAGASLATIVSVLLALAPTAVYASSAAEPTPSVPDLAVEPEQFADEAARLPDGLVEALDRDVGITGAEYLATAELASRGLEAVEALLDAGVDVSSPRVNDGEFVVTAGSQGDLEAIMALGMTATLQEPSAPDLSELRFEPAADLHGGAPYVYTDGAGSYRCSTGFTGVNPGTGAHQLLTAGHCLGSADAPRRLLQMTAPGQTGIVAGTIGLPVPNSFRAGDGWDFGLVAVTGADVVSRPSVLTWGGGSGAPTSSTPLAVRDATRAVVGSTLCKSGSTTGWSCGPIVRAVDGAFVQTDESTGAGYVLDALVSCIRLDRGDSGGAAVVGSTAVGITAAYGLDSDGAICGRAGATVGLFAPLVAPFDGAQTATSLYGTAWEPLVAVAPPTITSFTTGATFGGDIIQGSLAHGTPRHRVEVVIDGGAPRVVSVASGGAWQVDISDLGPGAHSYVVKARWGAKSMSSTTSGSWSRFSSSRIAGTDRYSTAAKISKETFPNGASTVFIANGLSFPDALSAGPAAALFDGPLLLTDPRALPTAVTAELIRLQPDRVIIVGGASVVSAAVANALGAFGTVERWAGSDRYATSREIARRAFSNGSSVAYVATGASFPDALSAGAAGASIGAPVILVPGTAPTADAATLALLTGLGVTEIRIAGGPTVVSSGMARSLGSVATVRRLAGADRYGTSLAINADVVQRANEAFFTSGVNFPDALAGSVLAGLRGAPMYIARATCIEPSILTHMADIGASRTVLFGAVSVLGTGVAQLRSC